MLYKFRSALLMPVFLLCLALVPHRLMAQASIILSANTTIDATNFSLYANSNLTIRNCTVTVNHSDAFPALNLNALQIENAGTLTQTAANTRGLQLTVAMDVNILNGGKIDVSGAGYPATQGPGTGQSGSVTNDYRACGAGHAGYGGNGYQSSGAGAPYGSLDQPVTLGSGGGNYGGNIGGSGGGAVKLQVGGTLAIQGGGGIYTYGADSPGRAGAGAGGSLWISANEIKGAGIINATGGFGNDSGGSGSGGRIAIYYNTNNFTGDTVAFGQASNYYYTSSAGSIYTKKNSDALGDLVFDRGYANVVWATANIPANFPVRNVTVRRGANVLVEGDETFASLSVWNYGTLGRKPGGVTLPERTLKLTVTGDASITQNGSISTVGGGYGASTGLGAGLNGDANNDLRGGGGGHGGQGGNGYRVGGIGGAVYDSVVGPIDAGSGGGSYGSNTGSNGGGIIRLMVNGILTVADSGTIDASGNDSPNRAGAGAGGSVWITVHDLRGNSAIKANGGYGNDAGGSGAGGRVAVYYDTSSFTGAFTAYGRDEGEAYRDGGAGTVYLKMTADASGDLLIDGKNDGLFYAATPLGDAGNLKSLTILGRASVVASTVAAGTLLMDSYARIVPAGSATSGGSPLLVNISGNATLQGRAKIEASGYGFPAGKGDGAGAAGSTSSGLRGAGGGHGGRGGLDMSVGAYGGTSYGSITLPDTAGSGGGNYGGNIGGAGGGAVRINVGGTLSISAGQFHYGGRPHQRGRRGQRRRAGPFN